MKIITNYRPREVIDPWELTKDERAEFDYYDWDAFDRGEGSAGEYVRYKGELLDLNEFVTTLSLTNILTEWDGYRSDSWYSGLVVRYLPDYEYVIVGRYST